MRTTMNLEIELVAQAKKMTKINETTALVSAGLRELIAHESARRLAALGGSEPELRPIPRRRPSSK
jgi:hypothetical protein